MNIVQEGEMRMNTIVTSKEAILTECRRIVMAQGIPGINMRSVAQACGVAVGSLYNYFPSKSDLIRSAVDDVWRDIFHMSGSSFHFDSFTDCLVWLFESVEKGCEKYPGFFNLHSVSFASGDKEKGRQMIERYSGHMRKSLLDVLNRDPQVRPDAFNDSLTREAFIEVIYTAFTTMLMKEENQFQPLLEITARCIY